MHTTAAELWRTWIRTKVIQPTTHDADLAETLCEHLGVAKASEIPAAMDASGWSPRELLHAIAGELQSFSGMMQDLLALYELVGARTATGDNLRISYEFIEGEPFDLLLSKFREEVAEVRSAVRELATPLSFDLEFAFESPIRDFADWNRGHELFGLDDFRVMSLPRTTPRPVATGNPHADGVIERGLRVVDTVFAVLESRGPTIGEATRWLWGQGPLHEDDVEQAVVHGASDAWPLMTAAALHGLADIVREGREGPNLVDRVDAWLDNFASSGPIEVTVERFIDVLSLPSWGKRHELYAAWIATQFNQALPTDRLEFVVIDQTLRFPFKATHIATVQAAGAVHELWCEIRSELIGADGIRLRGIQPDYRVLRRNRDESTTTILGVEVKQYRGGAAKRHGNVLAMYAAGLLDADVLLVGHGPIGDARKHVPLPDRDRTKVFENVRPGRDTDAAAFRAAVAGLLPPRPERVELAWDKGISDLDLHMRIDAEAINWQNPRGEGGVLRADAFNGGPEIIDLAPDVHAAIEIEVMLYSSEVTSVLAAQPRLKIVWIGGMVTDLLPPSDLPRGQERRWVVCRVEPQGTVTPLAGTTIVTRS